MCMDIKSMREVRSGGGGGGGGGAMHVVLVVHVQYTAKKTSRARSVSHLTV